jgi:hypothetical protein
MFCWTDGKPLSPSEEAMERYMQAKEVCWAKGPKKLQGRGRVGVVEFRVTGRAIIAYPFKGSLIILLVILKLML